MDGEGGHAADRLYELDLGLAELPFGVPVEQLHRADHDVIDDQRNDEEHLLAVLPQRRRGSRAQAGVAAAQHGGASRFRDDLHRRPVRERERPRPPQPRLVEDAVDHTRQAVQVLVAAQDVDVAVGHTDGRR